MILGMVMAEQEDNVQFLRGSVDRIKNRLGVPCSTIMCNARTGVQRNMRNHKNRFIVTGLNLRIKICSKTRCQRPAVAQTAIICCIIVLIQYIYAVIVGIIRTGGGNAANLTVVVALNEYLVNILAKVLSDAVTQCIQAIGRRSRTVFAGVIVVTAADKTISLGIAAGFYLLEDSLYRCNTGSMVRRCAALILEIRASHHNGRVFFTARGKYTCRQQ